MPGEWIDLAHLLGRLRHEDAQTILRSPVAGLQDRNHRFRLAKIVGRLLDIQFRDQPGCSRRLTIRNVSFWSSTFFCELQPFFVGSHLDVVRGHFGLQEHEDVVVAGALGIEIGVGRLDGPAKSSPEIQFPGGVETDRHVVVVMPQAERLNG